MSFSLKETVSSIKLTDTNISFDISCDEAYETLTQNSKWPGLILNDNKKYFSITSRQRFYELMSLRFGRDLFSKRPLKKMIKVSKYQPLVLDESTNISDAVRAALERDREWVIEPIVVQFNNSKCMIMDVHDLLLKHSEIHEKITKELDEMNQFKTEMLQMASHDLKNPLGILLGFLEVMKTDLKDNYKLLDILNRMTLNTESMLHTIHEFLDTARLDVKSLDVQRKKINVFEFMNTIVLSLKDLAKKKNQNLFFQYDLKGSFCIKIDPIKMKSVLENLISNALKFSNAGKDVNIHAYEKSGSVFISVKDEGPGISVDDQKMLFQKFQRLSAKPTGNESSTGLGLFIAYRIVKIHDGKITVKSKLGKGTIFTVQIPI